MAKFKPKRIVKHDGGEIYAFIGGKANVPGMWHRSTGKPYQIILKEFNNLKEKTNVISEN